MMNSAVDDAHRLLQSAVSCRSLMNFVHVLQSRSIFSLREGHGLTMTKCKSNSKDIINAR
jgi:hypothetical protein